MLTRSQVHDISVLYEDNHLIAVNKRSGDIVQGDKTGDTPLSDLLKQYLKEKYQKPGNVFVGVIHRIDRPVSGVVLFAKTSKALARMNQIFSGRELQKTYWAVVRHQPPKDEDTLVHWLKKNESKNVVSAFSHEVKDSLRSVLSYQVIGKRGDFYLLEVLPQTGRPHQIRVQLASMQCPILGDNKYGYPRANRDRSICLHARKLEFLHPTTQAPICIEAPLPDEPFWKSMNMGE